MVADRVTAGLAAPFALSDVDVMVTASVGIAFVLHGLGSAEQLIHDADVAMYQAKRKGGGGHQRVDIREQDEVHGRASMVRDLRGATARGELRVDYQPIVRSGDERITGVEALLRWTHPTWSLVPVETLVLVAEDSGLISEIGRWVLERSCTDAHRWTNSGGHDLGVSVNVSSKQLLSPDFLDTVTAVLAGTGTEPQQLTLEITESQLIQDSEMALVVLNSLKALGVTLALDDFGTGYSSLCYLKQFPVDIVKIDRGFVADVGRNSVSRAIVSSVVQLAHAIGMTVVAEGVEEVDQYHEVMALGCDSCQGYLFAKPCTADNIDMLLEKAGDGSRRRPWNGPRTSPKQGRRRMARGGHGAPLPLRPVARGSGR